MIEIGSSIRYNGYKLILCPIGRLDNTMRALYGNYVRITFNDLAVDGNYRFIETETVMHDSEGRLWDLENGVPILIRDPKIKSVTVITSHQTEKQAEYVAECWETFWQQ